MTRCRVVFQVPGGGRVAATPQSAKRSVDGDTFVWVRTQDGDITRAFSTGEQA